MKVVGADDKGGLAYRVWWAPQIPGEPFYVQVETLEMAVGVADVLAKYDLFQYENRVKGDYANVGGIEEWVTWDNEDGLDSEWMEVDGEELEKVGRMG